MESEQIRIRRLERHVADLEQRVAGLEEAVGYEVEPETSPSVQAAAVAPNVLDAPEASFAGWRLATDVAVEPEPPVISPAPQAPRYDPIAWSFRQVAQSVGAESGSLNPAEPGPPVHGGGSDWSPPSAASSGPAFSFSLRELEERFAGRAMAWIGGAALIGAAVFFLSLAFSRGWINEEMRVAIGLIAGTGALAGGAVMFDRKNPLVGNVLVAVGLGITSIALFAATRAYGLVAPEFGLAAALIAAAAAAAVAIRYDAREVAVFGLLAALGAPPVMGASPNVLTLLFVAVTLVGTTAIALFKTWPYLPALAFILAAPQLASYLSGGVAAGAGLIALVGFWLINITAAAGEEWRVKRDDLRPSSATLVLANGTFALWGGYTVLTNAGAAQWLGTYIAVASLAHLAVGGWFLRRQGLQHLFGNLAAGTGVALVAIASFVQLGAPAVPVAWAAEAAALAWLAARRMHKWSALAGLVLGALAVAHLLVAEYPLSRLGADALQMPAVPWLHAEGGSLFAVVGALLVAAVLVHVRWFRSAAVGLSVLLVEYATVFEVRGPVLTTTIVLVALAAIVLERVIETRGTRPSLAAVGAWVPAFPFALMAAAIAGVHAVLFVVGVEYPPEAVARGTAIAPSIPWLHAEGASVLAVLIGLGVAARLVPVRWVRSLLAAVGVLVVEYSALFEVRGPGLAATLVLLGLVALVLERLIAARGTEDWLARIGAWPITFPFAAGAAVVAGVHAALFVAFVEFPPAQFGSNPGVPFGSAETMSLVFLLAGLIAAGRLLPDRGVRSLLGAVGILSAGWALCTQLVDLPLFASLAVLMPLALILERGLARLEDRPDTVPFRVPGAAGWLAPLAGAAVWAAGAGLAAVDYTLPLLSMHRALPLPPFLDEAAAAGLALAGAALAAARWTSSRDGRTAALLAATSVAAWVVPLEVRADLVVPLWLVLAGIALVIARRGGLLETVAHSLAFALGLGAVMLAFGAVAPPDRLWVSAPYGWTPPPLLPVWTLAIASVGLALGIGGRRGVLGSRSPWLYVAAEATVVYLVSIGAVDVFQRQVGGPVAVEELAKQAQVVMSVCWTAIGVASLGWGLSTGIPLARHVGFGLLAMATTKVVLLDLAFMDVAYRALVLAGLGILLLLGAWLYTRMRGPRSGDGGIQGRRFAG